MKLQFLLLAIAATCSGNALAQDSLPAAVVAPGLVEPASEERTVGAEITGILKTIKVDENDRVTAGQIIAVIGNDEEVARLAEAKANESEASVNLKLADQQLSRQRQLIDSNTTAQSELDRALSHRDALAANLDRARALTNLAQANLDKTILRYPIDGTILRRYILSGEAVTNQPPTRLVSIGDLSHLRVRAEVDELDIGRLRIGQKVEVKADAYPDLKAFGTVTKITMRMGERGIQTSRSDDRIDSNILPVLINLEAGVNLPVGLRVDTYFLTTPPQQK